MAYLSYRGPADVVFTHGAIVGPVHNVEVLLQQTHTSTFQLYVPLDHPERPNCSEVRVTLPNGWVEYGPVTYIGDTALVFYTGDEWGIPREQPNECLVLK